MITFNEEQQERKLRELRFKEQEDLARMLSEKYKLPYIDLSTTSINTDALREVPEEIARKSKVAGFHLVGKNLYLAVISPAKKDIPEVVEDLERKRFTINMYIASEKSLERAWERYSEISHTKKTKEGILDISGEQIADYTKTLKKLPDLSDAILKLLSGKDRYQTTSVLELLIAGALATKASDIHLEPKETSIKIRLRLDGILVDLGSMNHKTFNLVLSRIKLMSGLKINVKDDAQDGRFSIKFEDIDIEVRTSVIPGAYGESIVLRILNPKSIAVPLEELGINKKTLAVLDKEIRKPHGMILNTGPTGSGKTTTLYAILRKLNTTEIKIITIEDPIEYHLAGITQTQVKEAAGYTFLEGLRSALRQDPDIIMIGEIRDEDTARTAVNAALTGHLVLSTLHTNTAVGAIPRLIDLKVNPKVIGSSLNAIMAQRLVRKLCEKCKKEKKLNEKDKVVLQKIVDSMPKEDRVPVESMWVAVGCEDEGCNETGYSGRIGIYEIISMDESIENIISENPSGREIKKAGESQGLLDMRQDGVIKILSGVTSLSELRRVVDMEKELD